MSETYKDESRRNWIRAATRQHGDDEILKIGCLQRIADATELMAKSYAALIAERDYYKRLYENEEACSGRLLRSRDALRGVITKMKRGRK